MLADPERVDLALGLWRRLRHSDVPNPIRAAADPRWEDWMDGYERHQVLAMSRLDLLAFVAVVDAEVYLIEVLAEICDEPDVRAALEQRRRELEQRRGGP